MTAPTLAWATLSADDLGRYLWHRRVPLPFPLDSSRVGRWEPSVSELLGDADVSATPLRGEGRRLLESLVTILRTPAYCAFMIRAEHGVETHYAAVGAGGVVVVVVDTGEGVHLTQVADTHIAVGLAAQLPRASAGPPIRVDLSQRTAAEIEAAIARGDPEHSVRSAMAAAGVPDELAGLLRAGADGVVATGTVGAVRYIQGEARLGNHNASWTELPGGGVVSSRTRAGNVVWEPMSTEAVSRAVTQALMSLAA